MGRYLIWLLFSLRGRIGRAQWWLGSFLAFFFALPALVVLLLDSQDLYRRHFIPLEITGLAGTYVGFALDAKRFQDRNRGAGWALFLVATYSLQTVQYWLWYFGIDGNTHYESGLTGAALTIVIWFIIDLGCARGVSGPNQYGDDPLLSPVLSMPGASREPQPSAGLTETSTSPLQNGQM